jgi:hypothetical protein
MQSKYICPQWNPSIQKNNARPEHSSVLLQDLIYLQYENSIHSSNIETTRFLPFAVFRLTVGTHQYRLDKPLMLLTFPGEVRNQVYRLVLVSDGRILFDSTYREPALLATCRQATPIFLLENEWYIALPNWEYPLYNNWAMYVRWEGITNPTTLHRTFKILFNPWRNRKGIIRLAKFMCQNNGPLCTIQFFESFPSPTLRAHGCF